jgi:predicted HAD superfamily Cof-like phosphohydrolase
MRSRVFDLGPAAMVREFHQRFGLGVAVVRTRARRRLRARLVREESRELRRALRAGDTSQVAKELADLVYVAYGTALSEGIELDVALAEVHHSNLTKLVDGKPVMRRDGKVLKGPNYRAPDMSVAVLS